MSSPGSPISPVSITPQVVVLTWVSTQNTFIPLPDDIARNVTRYTITNVPVNAHQHRIEGVNLIWDIPDDALIELTLTLPRMYRNIDEAIARKSLQIMIEAGTRHTIDYFQEYYLNDEWVLTPIREGSPLYLTQLEVDDWRVCADPDLLLDWRVVDTTGLAWLSKYSQNFVTCKNLIFCPNEGVLPGEEYRGISMYDKVWQELMTLRSKGVASIHTSNTILIYELAELWQLNIAHRNESKNVMGITSSPNVDLGMPLHIWVQQAIKDIHANSLPKVIYYPLDPHDARRAIESYSALSREIPQLKNYNVLSGVDELHFRFGGLNDMMRWRELIHNNNITFAPDSTSSPDIGVNAYIYAYQRLTGKTSRYI